MGMPSIGKWAASQKAKLDSKAEKSKNKMETIRAGLGMVSLQKQFGQDMALANTAEEKAAVSSQMMDAMATSILRIMWTTTVVDITNTLYETIQMVLFDQSVDKGTREQRARGLKILGEIFMETLETTTGKEKDAKAIYEEAAFAAMLETIKRKEEANRKASGH
jgi:X-domain of DnaJ-containing